MANQETGNGVHPLVAAGEMMVVPGVYDVLSAKLAERAGFPVVVLTGYGVAASFLGEPDFGLLTQSEVLPTACGELVAEANASGGGDNITAVLVRVEASEDDQWVSSTSAPPPPEPVVVKPDPDAMDIGADDTAKVTPLTDPEAILAALEKADRNQDD